MMLNKSNYQIILYILLGLSSALAIYFFMESRSNNEQLTTLEQEYRQKIDRNSSFSPLLAVDSLVLQGDYQNALGEYKTLLSGSDSLLQSAIAIRIELVKKLIKERNQQLTKTDSSSDTTIIVSRVPKVKHSDNPIYDSLNFALVKASVQIESLRRQLKNAKSGEYLKFTNRKGNEVYYVGQIKKGKANGEGVALLSTGSRYEGEWENNMRQGEGIFYWPDGAHYEGSYHNDMREGTGSYNWPNGEKFTGQWKNDQRNGYGTFYDKDAKATIKGLWENDELVDRKK